MWRVLTENGLRNRGAKRKLREVGRGQESKLEMPVEYTSPTKIDLIQVTL